MRVRHAHGASPSIIIHNGYSFFKEEDWEICKNRDDVGHLYDRADMVTYLYVGIFDNV